jgi:hypothetical protein
MDDPVVEETREARRQLNAEVGGGLNTLFQYLVEIERENAGRVVRLGPKPALTVRRIP